MGSRKKPAWASRGKPCITDELAKPGCGGLRVAACLPRRLEPSDRGKFPGAAEQLGIEVDVTLSRIVTGGVR